MAAAGRYDGFVAVGGGSVIDTAKAANLLATHPAPPLDYVNPPIGEGKPPPGPLEPLIAVPTTAGTGSETTGVAIFDWRALHAKTGIAHRLLRPSSASSTRTTPGRCRRWSPLVGIRCPVPRPRVVHRDPVHEPARARAARLRPSYQGANPFSDVWARRGAADGGPSLPRVSTTPATTRLAS